MSTVLTHIADGIATVTLNRPEARNALNSELAAAFPEAILECDQHADVFVIILTGADPAFCAGFDLRELSSRERGSEPNPPPPYRAALPPHRKPIIGAINGAAVTGGFEIALACDFLIASEKARFADTHARVGLLPGWGLTVMLPEAIGIRRAKQLSLSGAFLDARTALRWRLVNEVVAHDQLLPRAREIAAQIVANPAHSVQAVMALYDEVAELTPPDAWVVENERAREWIAHRFDTAGLADRREGILETGRRLAGGGETHDADANGPYGFSDQDE
jgi:enoyl-CoA hydratase